MGNVYVIILKNGEIWFDDCNNSINEARSDASAKWGSDVKVVVTYRTFLQNRDKYPA